MNASYNKVHLCLNCSKTLLKNQYERLKFKNIFSIFGVFKTKCPNCRNSSTFILVDQLLSESIYILNQKGYTTLKSAIVESNAEKIYAYIDFLEPIDIKLKPKFMSYISKWKCNSNTNVIIRDEENRNSIQYVYSQSKNISAEIQSVSQGLLDWANSIPKMNSTRIS